MIELPADAVLALPGRSSPPPEGLLLGRSREGRPLHGHRFGRGPLRVSLLAGAHADEPVGPALLERLAAHLARLPEDDPLLARVSWSLVPHVNPDGRHANRGWTGATVPVTDAAGRPDRGYALAAYLEHAVREPPGDDVEFGFPRDADDAGARPENRAVAAFLAAGAEAHGPYHLHASLHGMGFAAGPWFLLDRAWIDRTEALRRRLAHRVREMGYRLHDVDRGGEKGFTRIAEGFTTRPDSRAMIAHFRGRGDEATAALFRPSSMEHVRSLGGDPLTAVSEMPLFLLPGAGTGGDAEAGTRGMSATGAGGGTDGEPPPDPTGTEGRLAFLAWARRRLAEGGPEGLAAAAQRHGIRPMPIGDQMRLQLALVEAGIDAVRAQGLPA